MFAKALVAIVLILLIISFLTGDPAGIKEYIKKKLNIGSVTERDLHQESIDELNQGLDYWCSKSQSQPQGEYDAGDYDITGKLEQDDIEDLDACTVEISSGLKFSSLGKTCVNAVLEKTPQSTKITLVKC